MSLKTEDNFTFKYPSMRHELLHNIYSLSDLGYQWRAWVKDELPPPKHDEFDYAVHFLYDDTTLAESPEECIGLFVKDEHEVQLIKAVIHAINRVFNVLGKECSDEQYISSLEWSEVLRTASEAWQAMSGKQLSVG